MAFDTSNFFIFSVFIAGLISFFSPCILPVMPVYVGLLSDDVGNKNVSIFGFKIYTKPVVRTFLFVVGLSVVFVILGFGAGSLGSIVNSKWLGIAMGTIVIILGLHQGEFINIKFAQRSLKIDMQTDNKKGYLGAFLLGMGFSFGWTPCIGPVLTSVIAISASGNGMYGLTLMAVYSLGMSIPFLLISAMSSLALKHLGKIRKHMMTIKKVGGIIIILMGVLLIMKYLNLFNGII